MVKRKGVPEAGRAAPAGTATAKKKIKGGPIEIGKLATRSIEVFIKGTSPIIMNAMSAKARQDLLIPPKKKTAADKAVSLKHDVLSEYRNSCYKSITDSAPTRILFPVSGLKTALMAAALEVPGSVMKKQVAQLIWTEGDYVPVYGKPEMIMSVIRTADIKQTPDIRTRVIMKEWCIKVRLTYVTPALAAADVLRLIEAAGMIIGIGDFRQEKGKGSYGQFMVTDEDDFRKIAAAGGIKEQDAALENPVFYDSDTKELYSWYTEERKKRGR